MNIYVGNISYAATEIDLEELFGEYGQVASATIIRDRYDGRSKGFGFVEMENQEDGERAIEALDGQEMMGRPLKVDYNRKDQPHQQRRERWQSTTSGRTDRNSSDTSKGKTFHNPYTFVPTPPRGHIKRGKFAGDFNPLKHPCGQKHNLDHASLKDDLWTGHIPIKLTTITPLILLKDDGRERKTDKHQTYDVYDCIPESSLRGMLRSAYEVVTNSRYACFRNEDRLAYRMTTDKALKLIPAIVKNGMAYLCPGTSSPTDKGPSGAGEKGAMYAAMLTLYADKELQSKCDADYTPKTGDQVWAEIVLCQHEVSPRNQSNWSKDFLFWKVIKVWPRNKHSSKPHLTRKSIYPSKRPTPNPRRRQPYYKPVAPEVRKIVKGRVLITNKNIGTKHDERIFFLEGMNAKNLIKCDVSHLEEAWRMRIQSYRDAHTKPDIFHRRGAEGKPWKVIRKDPPQQDEMGWSPHLYEDGEHKNRWGRVPHDALELQEGDMVYARCEFDPTGKKIKHITDLFPVMISRELYENNPEDLLDASLRPAKKLEELSPADRLFGWVLQENRDPEKQDQDRSIPKSYKSRIRVVCDDGSRPEIIQRFEGGGSLPLTILGQPKPAQGRFYVAKDKNGAPQGEISKTDAGYNNAGKKGLRGRKQYWHHSGLEAECDEKKQKECYWQPSVEDRTFKKRKGRYQEYRRPDIRDKQDKRYKPQTDPQNRSITGWIKPGEVFKASLYVQNLQPAEVGALLWLLSLPKGHYFRLGYGKPLGFGSVSIEIDRPKGALPLCKGGDWKKKYYTSLLNGSPPATLNEEKEKNCIQEFWNSMVTGYPAKGDTRAEKKKELEEKFKSLDFIAGFLRVLQGPGDNAPIHYPRLEYPKRDEYKPNPEGKNFEWFVANDDNRGGKKLALPAVTDEKGLSYYPPKR